MVDDQVSVAPCPAGTIELFNDSVTVEPPPEDEVEEPPELDEELELLELPEDEEVELPLDEELVLLLEDEPELLAEEGPSLLPPPPPHAVSDRTMHIAAQAPAIEVRSFVTLSPGEPTAVGEANQCRTWLAVVLLLTPSDAPCIGWTYMSFIDVTPQLDGLKPLCCFLTSKPPYSESETMEQIFDLFSMVAQGADGNC